MKLDEGMIDFKDFKVWFQKVQKRTREGVTKNATFVLLKVQKWYFLKKRRLFYGNRFCQVSWLVNVTAF